MHHASVYDVLLPSVYPVPILTIYFITCLLTQFSYNSVNQVQNIAVFIHCCGMSNFTDYVAHAAV